MSNKIPQDKQPSPELRAEMKAKFDLYSGYGKKAGEERFTGMDYKKILKDAKLFQRKPPFSVAPPNRVDFTFTYACTNEPTSLGKKMMNYATFEYALLGAAHETKRSHTEIYKAIANVVPSFDATQAEKTRFHDDESNYTGVHKAVHLGAGAADLTSKADIRRNRSQQQVFGGGDDAAIKTMRDHNKKVSDTFDECDVDGSTFLDTGEVKKALVKLNPKLDNASSQDALDLVVKYVLKDDADGRFTKAEFQDAYNNLIDILELISAGGTADLKGVMKKAYIKFIDARTQVATEEMDNNMFKQMCQDCFGRTFTETQEGCTRADMIWSVVLNERNEKQKGTKLRKIDFKHFYDFALMGITKAVHEDCNKRGVKPPTFDQVCTAIWNKEPAINATQADAVKYHDDKSMYTGSHVAKHGQEAHQRSISKAQW